jgi:hypothetical protein
MKIHCPGLCKGLELPDIIAVRSWFGIYAAEGILAAGRRAIVLQDNIADEFRVFDVVTHWLNRIDELFKCVRLRYGVKQSAQSPAPIGSIRVLAFLRCTHRPSKFQRK